MREQRTERLEAAWLLREFAWSLKRLADRYEAACCAIDEAKRVKAEAAAKVWHERARERLAKFTAARRKYLGLSEYRVMGFLFVPDGAKRIDPPQHVEVKSYAANPWRAGIPPDNYPGRVKAFNACLDDLYTRRMVECQSDELAGCVAWRPA